MHFRISSVIISLRVRDRANCTRGYSSAGRALEWHSRGQRFDPAYLSLVAVGLGANRRFEHKDFFCEAKAPRQRRNVADVQIRSVTEARSAGVSRLSPPRKSSEIGRFQGFFFSISCEKVGALEAVKRSPSAYLTLFLTPIKRGCDVPNQPDKASAIDSFRFASR